MQTSPRFSPVPVDSTSFRAKRPALAAMAAASPRPTAPGEWIGALRARHWDAAWDAFITEYRALIFSAIRHYLQDHDDVMDVFALVCESLRAEQMRRLREWAGKAEHVARPSTWLVKVVRNRTIDWIRQENGRPRPSKLAAKLPPLERRIYALVFVGRRSHAECYEALHTTEWPSLTLHDFRLALRATYAAVTKGRHDHVLHELAPPLDDEEEVADDHAIEQRESKRVLERALATLEETERALVMLYVVERLPAARVAAMLGLADAKAVYNRIGRVLACLRTHLEEQGFSLDAL